MNKMEYQKVINFLNNEVTQPSDFKTKNWVEINDDACGTYNTNSQNEFKTSCLSDCSDAYKLAKGTITAVGQAVDAIAIAEDRNDK